MELQRRHASDSNHVLPLDELRAESLQALAKVTGRSTVVYATRWTQGGERPEMTSIGIDDVHAFMEVLHQLPGPSLDLVLHSSGGSPTGAEAIVNYIRTKFPDLRVIVPLAAMSAATMMACAGNRIVMGKHSYLGPIDPQLILQTPLGMQAVPAHTIVKQFERAQAESRDPAKFPAWIPMLQQYGPGLIITCENVIRLSEELVRTWLAKWMFAGQDDGDTLAGEVAKALNDHGTHKEHGRFLARDTVRAMGLIVDDLEEDQEFQDAALTVFHAFSHTFTHAPHVQKIVESNTGKRFMKATAFVQVPLPGPPPMPQPG